MAATINPDALRITLASQELRDYSIALVIGHSGWTLTESVYDFPYAVGWLAEQVIDVRRDGDDDYPDVDRDGDWDVTISGQGAEDVALVMIAFDDGGLAAARIPDADGRVRSQQDLIHALRRIQANCLDDLLLEDPSGSPR